MFSSPLLPNLSGTKRSQLLSPFLPSLRALPLCRMKPTSCFLLILIPLVQLMILGNAQCSLDSTVDKKIKAALTALGN